MVDAEEIERSDRSWSGAPWTVKVYAALYVMSSILGFALAAFDGRTPPLWTALLSAVFFALLVVPIIRGSRIGWTAVMLAMVASLFLVPSQEPAAERAITAVHLVVSLTLLLHPRTQRRSRVRLW